MSTNPVFKSGNIAVITGGASGIGLALSTKCAGYGMKVVMVDNNGSNLSSAKSAIKGDVDTVEMDVTKIEDFEKLKSKIAKDYGGVMTFLQTTNSMLDHHQIGMGRWAVLENPGGLTDNSQARSTSWS
jgi:NAD(P)-dependent dehydrogenase (short-subunit alcohol dehydrogenase family)